MNIDYTKLNRNYKQNPIKVGEQLDYDDLVYLYWTLNLTKGQVAEIMGCSSDKIYKTTKQCNLVKPKEMRIQSQKNLMLEKYGTDNYMKTKEGKQKLSESMKRTMKKDKDKIVEKRKQTCKKNWGCDNPSQNSEIKERKKKTCLQNNGNENPQQCKEIRDKTQKTFEEKYNGNPLSKESILYESILDCMEEKYGCKNVMQNVEISNKTSKTQKERQEIYKQRNMEKYGVEYTSQLEEVRKKNSEGVLRAIPQIYETRKKHGTCVSSVDEEYIYEQLKELFEVKRQYYHKELYPFACDFYIPELNIYIEYNGTWTHGKFPYIPTEQKCIDKLNEWVEKAQTSQFYRNAIETWTIRDTKKRNWAQKHGLNWLEFFNVEEFNTWYNNIKEIYAK